MKRNTLHTALQIVTLFVMTLSSTGFTAVMKYCTMTESSTCCCEESHETGAASADGVTLSAPEASCLIQTIAGGRNEITATLHAAESVTLPAMAMMPFEPDAIGADAPASTVLPLSPDDAAPPGIDIYIRVNSFLI
jgi:hypothetical protein